jgi:hypothetical protein
MAKMTAVVRTLYLYLFAMLGLIFVAIGGVQLLDMTLRALVFKQADAMERYEMPPMPMTATERLDRYTKDPELSVREREMIRQSIREYEQWTERRRRIDPVVARRQRQAANSLAMILVGLPIYLYHWRLIRKSARRSIENRPMANSG